MHENKRRPAPSLALFCPKARPAVALPLSVLLGWATDLGKSTCVSAQARTPFLAYADAPAAVLGTAGLTNKMETSEEMTSQRHVAEQHPDLCHAHKCYEWFHCQYL